MKNPLKNQANQELKPHIPSLIHAPKISTIFKSPNGKTYLLKSGRFSEDRYNQPWGEAEKLRSRHGSLYQAITFLKLLSLITCIASLFKWISTPGAASANASSEYLYITISAAILILIFWRIGAVIAARSNHQDD
ncbi:MAG: hypothetical protein KTR21_11960 [Rhodobacteraceae bacterium]|nr:hypothetical protein [Paracoccaceae bacterium]